MLALIPARGGSKGLIGKNLRELAGRPLIAHTIAAALASEAIDRVVVTTDDEAIAEAARRAGAEVPFMRPAHLASDEASTLDVCLHACEELERRGAPRAGAGEPIEAFALLQPTSPLRSAADIDAAVALFYARRADTVIAVTEDPHPIAWTRIIDEAGVLRPHPAFAEVAAGRRQDHATTYHPNGAIYIIDLGFLRERQSLLSERTFAYVMPAERSVDVDTALDLAVAEALLAAR